MDGHEIRKLRKRLGLSQARLSEVSSIPQHELSAFELGKIALHPRTKSKLLDLLSDSTQVQTAATRQKRYRKHEFREIAICPDRKNRARKTDENKNYVSLLDELWQRHIDDEKSHSAISLFSGCGGFSLGFSSQGFKVKGFVELESYLRDIYKTNFRNCTEIGSDISKVTSAKLETVSSTLQDIDVIIGGPPCQGFSLSGKRDVNDPRNRLFQHYLRFVDAFKPKVAVLENVRLLTSMRNPDGGFVKDEIAEAFAEHGYDVKFHELNAASFGVPQHRERIIFVAVRMDLNVNPSIPPATHGESTPLFAEYPHYRTFADACSDLPFMESGGTSDDKLHTAVNHPAHVIDWLWNVEEGFSAHNNADPALRPPSGYNTTYKRQVWNEPAGTVQTTFGMISGCRNVHPIATRSLTIREAARIQSFPDTFNFEGSLKAIRTGIGNAVPPLLAANLANHVKYLLGEPCPSTCKSNSLRD